MKARTELLIDVNLPTLAQEYHKLVKFRQVNGPNGRKAQPYIPIGTVVEGPKALQLVQFGQASPLDEECRVASGRTEEEMRVAIRKQGANEAGIRGERDMTLWMNYVIEGYLPGGTDDKPRYKRGKNWDAWFEAEAAVVGESTKDPLDT